MKAMRIGELAKQCELSVEAIRYYEKQGLMVQPLRSESGYRLYQGNALAQLQFIKRAKEVGFSLKDIQELLSLRVDKDSHTCAEVKTIAEQKLIDIEQKLAELERMKLALQRITHACCGGPESASHCTILQALEH